MKKEVKMKSGANQAQVETFADAFLAGVEDATGALGESQPVGIEEFMECLVEIGYGERVQKVLADGEAAIYSRPPDAEALIYIINLKMGPVPTREEIMSRRRPARAAGLVRMPDTLVAKMVAKISQNRADRDIGTALTSAEKRIEAIVGQL